VPLHGRLSHSHRLFSLGDPQADPEGLGATAHMRHSLPSRLALIHTELTGLSIAAEVLAYRMRPSHPILANGGETTTEHVFTDCWVSCTFCGDT
jgi:hypothetical protein